jgi:hypothetical protein
MSRACARTIELRIRISRRDGASARCSASNRPDQPNASRPFTPPSKTLSTSGAISQPAARTASSEKKLSGRGERRQPHELELGRPDFPHANSSSRDRAVALTADRYARPQLNSYSFHQTRRHPLGVRRREESATGKADRPRLGRSGPPPAGRGAWESGRGHLKIGDGTVRPRQAARRRMRGPRIPVQALRVVPKRTWLKATKNQLVLRRNRPDLPERSPSLIVQPSVISSTQDCAKNIPGYRYRRKAS